MTDDLASKFFPDSWKRKMVADHEAATKASLKADIARMQTDQGGLEGISGTSFPWRTPDSAENALGTMWDLEISDAQLEAIHRRFQLGAVLTDKPIEEAFAQGFSLTNPDATPKDREFMERAMFYWKKDKSHFLRFCKLGLLHGHALFMFGYQDRRSSWSLPVTRGTQILFTQPVPKPYIQELKVSDSIPLKIEYARVNFNTDAFALDASRFLHIMWPKLVEEDKEGESFLAPVYNLLMVQNHTDWAIGQSLWRGASGLLCLMAPKKGYTEAEKYEALSGTANINARTVSYLPFGWNLKSVFVGQGNVAVARTYRTLLEQIAAGGRQPLAVLIGSQKGALSPGDQEDRDTWARFISSLQENYIKPQLERYFRKYQRAGQIPSGAFEVTWPTIETRTESEKKRERVINRALDRLYEIIDNDETWKTLDPKELMDLVSKKGKR